MAYAGKKKRRFMLRRKRTLDPNTVIDFKKTDTIKRFITDRGKIIPRRISGATAEQQRAITTAVKRSRYLALIPYSVSHRPERGFAGEMSAANATSYRDSRPPRYGDRDRGPRPGGDDRGPRPGGDDRGPRPDRGPAPARSEEASTEEKKGE
jgi:small subunit ribosomal protein S18